MYSGSESDMEANTAVKLAENDSRALYHLCRVLLCATSVFSVSLWLQKGKLPQRNREHRGCTETSQNREKGQQVRGREHRTRRYQQTAVSSRTIIHLACHHV